MRVAWISGHSRPHREIAYPRVPLFERSVPDSQALGSSCRTVSLKALGLHRNTSGRHSCVPTRTMCRTQPPQPSRRFWSLRT